jgi:hypothetical protein
MSKKKTEYHYEWVPEVTWVKRRVNGPKLDLSEIITLVDQRTTPFYRLDENITEE